MGYISTCHEELMGFGDDDDEADDLASMPARWDAVEPGMRIRRTGTSGPFREVEEIERIGARVIVGYADDPEICGRYGVGDRFEIEPDPKAG